MTDIYPAAAQRRALLKLVPALGCRDVALRRDECGDPVIAGKHGPVCSAISVGDRQKVKSKKPGFMIYVMG